VAVCLTALPHRRKRIKVSLGVIHYMLCVKRSVNIINIGSPASHAAEAIWHLLHRRSRRPDVVSAFGQPFLCFLVSA
jgi:hypothetical protein